MIEIDVKLTPFGASITLGSDCWVLPRASMDALTGPLEDEWIHFLSSLDSTSYDSARVTPMLSHWFALHGVQAFCLQGALA